MKFRYGEALNAAVLSREWNGDIHPNRDRCFVTHLHLTKFPVKSGRNLEVLQSFISTTNHMDKEAYNLPSDEPMCMSSMN